MDWSDSTSDSDTNAGGQSDKICSITRQLLQRLTSNNLLGAQQLDLHLRDSKLGKIRTLENLHLVPNVQVSSFYLERV